MTTSDEKSFDSLPPEVIEIVATYLPAREKLALRLTCRRLFSTLSTPAAWKRIHWINYNKKERKSLKSLLKLSQTVVKEVILTGAIAESSLSQLYKCRELRKVSGFKLTPAQVSSLLSSLPKLTHLSIEVNNIKLLVPLLPILGQLSQLVVNGEKHIEDFITAWASNEYKPQSLLLITSPFNIWGIIMLIQYSLPVSLHSATLSIYPRRRGPLDLCISKPIRYFEFGAGKGFQPCKHARSNNLDGVKCIETSYDPTLVHEGKRIVALEPVGNCGMPVYYSFADFAPIITSIEIHFFPPGALSYVAHHCPKLQELKITVADSCCSELLEGLSDISQECKELRGLNVLQFHVGILKVSVVSFWEVVSRMSRLTHLGVPYCLLVTPSLPDDSQSQAIEESAPKRRCVDPKAIEDVRRAIMSLRNVEAIQLRGVHYCFRECKLCYKLQFSLAVCETLSVFNNLQYVCFEQVHTVDLDCLLSNCKGIWCLSFHQCSVSLPEDTSSFANLQQLQLYAGYYFDLAKIADTLASAVNMTHLCLMDLPEVSAEKVCTLIQKIPSLVFLEIVRGSTCFKSFPRGISKKVNVFLKSIKRSYLEFQCHQRPANPDIDLLWW